MYEDSQFGVGGPLQPRMGDLKFWKDLLWICEDRWGILSSLKKNYCHSPEDALSNNMKN